MIEVLQLTDLHITRTPGHALRGLDTRASLAAVWQRARARHRAPDAILLTGDIADDGSADAYHHVREVFADAPCPVVAIPGNHDHPSTLREVLADPPFVTEGTLTLGAWRVHLLDSHLSGEVGGRLTTASLEHLKALTNASDRDAYHHLLVLHHPPVPLGSAWLDAIALTPSQPVLDVVDAMATVRGVIWGHAHQSYDGERAGTRLLCCPSTCSQFAPNRQDFAIDDARGPGYRSLHLGDDGSIDTEVVWLPINTGTVEHCA
ncbi:MAG: phosphodiesterase [Pseudomonadota bacterium]